jgi:hypothetical protein
MPKTIAGILVGLLLTVALAATGSLSSHRDRLVSVINQAIDAGDFVTETHPYEELFTECSLLQMQLSRHEAVITDVMRSVWIRPSPSANQFPCDILQIMLRGGPPVPKTEDYINYPFGSRFLLALVLNETTFHRTRQLYGVLSYASIVLLLIGVWYHSRATALTVLPICLALMFAFSQHRFGQNVAHAPGYFVGFSTLGLMLLAPKGWTRSTANRLFFYAMLGVFVGFFDILTGSIPILLSLAIVLNHLTFVGPVDTERYWSTSIRQALGVVAAFALGFAILTAIRMTALSVIGSLGSVFLDSLIVRVSGPGSIADVWRALWTWRHQLVMGGEIPSTIFLFACAASWVVAITALPVIYISNARKTYRLGADLFVLICAAVGVLAWYGLFTPLTLEHSWFMVRLLAVPAAYGVVALILVRRTTVSSVHRINSGLLADAALAAILILTFGVWFWQNVSSTDANRGFVWHSEADLARDIAIHPPLLENIQFSDLFELRSLSVRREGDVTWISLWWQPLCPTDDKDWQLFVHVIDETGNILQNNGWKLHFIDADRATDRTIRLSEGSIIVPLGARRIAVGFFRGDHAEEVLQANAGERDWGGRRVIASLPASN